VAAILVSLPAGAQVFEVEFSYSERIISDYASLFNSTGRDNMRRDTILHSGILQCHPVSDTLVQARMLTSYSRNTLMADSFPRDLTFLLHLDGNKRAVRVSLPDNGGAFPASITSWISEMNFKLPSGGATIEQKPDGDFSIMEEGRPSYSVVMIMFRNTIL
jgi:hypothetical protein